MPTPAAVESLAELLATKTPIVVIETHDERRVMALFGLVAQRQGREVWQWSASRGLCVAHNLKLELADIDSGRHADAADTRELPAALAAAEKLKPNALLLFFDVYPFLCNPVIARGMKELALKAESRGVQVVLVGHDVRLPDELAPYASRYELEPMTLERVKALFNDETQARRQRM